jgi:GT2 family glycosyltransferase
MPTCSIIIPVYGKASLTRRCLDTLLARESGKVDFEVIVVDDASKDMTPQLLAGYGNRIRVVTHPTNTGFATAVNDGAAIALGQYMVFLNNDTIPQSGWLDALVRYAENHPQAAVVGCKLLWPTGTIQHAGVVVCQDRFVTHIYAGFPADHPAVNKSRRFQIVTAACALMRRKPFEELAGFDTAFRNSYEDVDLCLRLGERGYEVHYCHESVLYHLESVSEGRFDHSSQNDEIYRRRWLHRVRPDDLQYYVEDGLLKLNYWEMYPAYMEVSPLLAVMKEGERERQAERLLRTRSRQVFDLLRDNIQLNVRVQEAELRAAAGASNGSLGPDMAKPEAPPAEPKLLCQGDIYWLSEEPAGRLISILLPVQNSASQLRELLPRLLKQRSRDNIEVVAVDGGSTDDTVDILREFRATVVSMDHGRKSPDVLLDLATKYATGSVLVLLNQSTPPPDEKWLAGLVAALDRDPTITGVCFNSGGSEDGPIVVLRSTPQLLRGRAAASRTCAVDALACSLPLNGPSLAGAGNGAVKGRRV